MNKPICDRAVIEKDELKLEHAWKMMLIKE